MSLIAYKYRIYPNEEQKILLTKTFGCVRFVWNENVRVFNSYDKETNPNPVYKTTTELRREYDWMREVSAGAIQQKEVDFKAFTRQFFNKGRKIKQKRCRFKSRKDKQSFRLPNQKFTLKHHKIRLEKIGWVNAIIDRRPDKEAKMMSVTISRDKVGKFFASILVEQEITTKYAPTGLSVGVDLGLKDFVTLSNGTRIPVPQFFRKSQADLARAQRHMSRKKKGSVRFHKCRNRVARLHSKIANQRKWFHHHVANQILSQHDFVGIEDLNVNGMVKNRRLAKSVSDAGWSNFIRILEYKAVNSKKIVHKVDRFFGSSKTCHCCGVSNPDLKLQEREWTCPSCGSVLDRDLNAAINIEKRAMHTAQGVTCAIRTPSGRKTRVGKTTRAIRDEAFNKSIFHE